MRAKFVPRLLTHEQKKIRGSIWTEWIDNLDADSDFIGENLIGEESYVLALRKKFRDPNGKRGLLSP